MTMTNDLFGNEPDQRPVEGGTFDVRACNFRKDGSSAVTVDMVGLLGASVMLGTATLNVVSPGI